MELSVILPVRDEAQNLPKCLETLVSQSEPGFLLGREWQIILVDDGSSDGTMAIARGALERIRLPAARDVAGGSLGIDPLGDREESGPQSLERPATPGVILLEAPSLIRESDDTRVGSSGKSNACWTGAQAAVGGCLLFLDADVRLQPGALSRSLREAEKHEAALLSYWPRQIVVGAAQQLVQPLIFSELVIVYPPAQVNDPARALAAANGQFLLVDREAYFAVGGHHALREPMLEDFALARAIKRSGGRLRLRYAPDALVSPNLGSYAEMVERCTRTLAALMPSPLALAAWRGVDLLLLFGLPLLAVGVPHLVLWQRAALLLLWLRTGLRFYTRVARANMGVLATTASPLGLPVFIFLLLRSSWAYRVSRRVSWKGRTYTPNRR